MNDSKLEVRLPSRLKQEFIKRCEQEGYVPSEILRAVVIIIVRRGPKEVLDGSDRR